MIADNNLLVKRDLVINTSADNVAALYFKDSFQLTLKTAGLLASLTGMMNIFARALGGMLGDWVGNRSGLQGRSLLLGLVVFMEGLALTLFSRLTGLVPAIAVFLVFGLFVCMAVESPMRWFPWCGPVRLGRRRASSVLVAMWVLFSRVFFSSRKDCRAQTRFSIWDCP